MVSDSKTLIIKVAYGGLGDHLFLSHLPRIAKESGRYREVLVSNCSAYRSEDYRKLIWEPNPYIDGFTDEDAPPVSAGRIPTGGNLLDAIMYDFGLDDGKLKHEPELYLRPDIDDSLSGSTIYDPNFVSFVGKIGVAHIEKFFDENGIAPDWMLKPRERSLPVAKVGGIMKTTSLSHYCSVICSARQFICLTSGGATLAAALRVPTIALWGKGQDSAFHHSRLHRYICVRPSLLQTYFPKGAMYIESSLRFVKVFVKQTLALR